MKKSWITIVFSTLVLSSCGGSEGDLATSPSKVNVNEKLSNTSWIKECSPYNKFANKELTGEWNVKIKLSIDYSLKSTYRTEYFHPTDTECNSLMFDSIDISRFEITGKIMTEESVEANGLNETFIYSSENSELVTHYTLIYIDSEKLYFGQKSGENLGKTSETRHSSVSLDHYFTKIIN